MTDNTWDLGSDCDRLTAVDPCLSEGGNVCNLNFRNLKKYIYGRHHNPTELVLVSQVVGLITSLCFNVAMERLSSSNNRGPLITQLHLKFKSLRSWFVHFRNMGQTWPNDEYSRFFSFELDYSTVLKLDLFSKIFPRIVFT